MQSHERLLVLTSDTIRDGNKKSELMLMRRATSASVQFYRPTQDVLVYLQ